MPQPADQPARPTVRVERSGGFAGIPRRWEVTASPVDAARWCVLIDACPWPSPTDDGAAGVPATASPTTTGADRFAWLVIAVSGASERSAVLSDQDAMDATGPWRPLIDAVRSGDAPPPPASPTEQ